MIEHDPSEKSPQRTVTWNPNGRLHGTPAPCVENTSVLWEVGGGAWKPNYQEEYFRPLGRGMEPLAKRIFSSPLEP